MPRDNTPTTKAARTARWATTMTRWAISFANSGKRSGTRSTKRWQIVTFAGPMGSESRGIVDPIAIRRDHRTDNLRGFRAGDLFEIVLIQIKGGGAAWPRLADLKRLHAVKRRYGAKHVVLAAWRKGSEPEFYVLRRVSEDRELAWKKVTAAFVFGAGA